VNVRHFRDAHACQTAPHNHLAGKFHPATAKPEIADGACVETTQPAGEIAELRPEKDTAYETQERIADPAMERGHGSPSLCRL
jgi:hypothetical protein